MLNRMTPKSLVTARAIALPLDGEEALEGMNAAPANRLSLYTVAVVLRLGLVAAILLKAFAIWQW
ncbi:MAG: hypothetical protein KF832_09130 [Caldilineaceae bacterium]|nr:hypothetical protein [Caldilineaceae bacterium]